MADKTQDLEQTIHLALEAAAAANDTADEVAKLSGDTQRAADRMDKFAKGMKPALFGVLAGSVASAALGGLVYMRTLSEMRTATATQVEALAVFSQSVDDLRRSLSAFDAATTSLEDLKTAQTDGFARIEAALAPPEEADDASETDPVATAEMTLQMMNALPELIQQSHQQTQDGFTMAISDLQLAMTRMLANRPVPEAVEKPATTAQAPRPPKRPPQKTKQKTPAKRATAPNPFSYP